MKKLATYKKKRDLKKSKEPKAKVLKSKGKGSFMVHKHKSKRPHYDLRIAIGGVLKSWAIPKGISKKRGEKRLAVKVEDHPMAYAKFEGTIPKGHYGAGKVEIYDKGKYENLAVGKTGKPLSIRTSLKDGRMKIFLHGKKLKGIYVLFRLRENNWLIFKSAK